MAVLTVATSAIVEEMGHWLQQDEYREAVRIAVEGHADRMEKDVSLARARAVKGQSVFHGVSSRRIRVQSCRAWHPLSRTSSRMNSRVEVHFWLHDIRRLFCIAVFLFFGALPRLKNLALFRTVTICCACFFL